MRARWSPVVLAGVVAGVLFYLHALLPNSHAYPLLWPLLGGGVAVGLAMRAASPAPRTDRWRAALRAGGVAGGVFLGATLPTLALLNAPTLAPLARALGATGPVPVTAPVVTGLALAALLSVPAATLGGLLAMPLLRVRRG